MCNSQIEETLFARNWTAVDSIYDLVSSQMSLILRQSGTTRCLQCYSAHGSSSLFWSFCTWKQFPVFIIQFLLFCTCFYHSVFVILHQHSSLFLLFLFIIFHTETVPCFCYFISSLLHIETADMIFVTCITCSACVKLSALG